MKRNRGDRETSRHPSLIIVSMCLLVSVLLGASLSQTSAKKPISKNGLLEAIRLNGLSTQELVNRVNQRGVNFRLTAQDEAEFRAAGARPELIDAVRANYRAESVTTTSTTPHTNTTTTKPPANVPAGPPLSKNEIVTLLQSGVPAARVEQFVEVRGVSFAVTPEIAREITAAGGNRSLIGAITEKSNETTISNQPSRGKPAVATGPDYDELTEQATAAMLANNSALAMRYSQEAIRMDPNQATGYQLLGFTQLYGYHDSISADKSYRAAIERGGSGVFRVYHDHFNGTFQQHCQGSMFVTRGGVTFKADDGNHTFEATDAEIKESKINALIGADYGAFHLKVARAADKKTQNYNFAPYSTKQVESNLIINLIQSYQ
ncbi:MAG TPA: hypothetical protein VFV34_14970 [Blastocatellia bacterium]|nr:hypothetical protein [Blastocatellia bacterium]